MRRRPQQSHPGQQAIDDMTGFKVNHASLKKQWDGMLTVDPDKRNPQDCIRPPRECAPIPCPRPEPPDRFIAQPIQWENFELLEEEAGGYILMEGVFVTPESL